MNNEIKRHIVRVQAEPLNDFQLKMVSQLMDMVKQVDVKYPQQVTHWPFGAVLYHIDSKGQITVWHYRKLWQRSVDCEADEVGWGSNELVNATGMYYLPDGTPLQSRWWDRGGGMESGMKDIRVKIGRTIGKDERVGIINRHRLSNEDVWLSTDGLKKEFEFYTIENLPLAVIVRIDKPVELGSWWIGNDRILENYEDYTQLSVIAPPVEQQLMKIEFSNPEIITINNPTVHD